MVLVAVLLTSLFALAISQPMTRRSLVVHEKRTVAPTGFISLGAAPRDASINLRIGLFSKDIEGLERVLYDVSTPSSPQYGQHLNRDEVNAYIAPDDDALSAVNAWLHENGLTPMPASSSGDWINVKVSVSKANELLGTKYEVFAHKQSGKKTIRCLSYSVPAELQKFVQAIHPTTSFDLIQSGSRVLSSPRSLNIRAVPAYCARAITPACLQALYGIPTTPATQASNKIAVSGFIDQFAETADLRSFLAKFRSGVTANFTVELLDGGKNIQDPHLGGIEANLDVQYTVGIATNVSVVFVSVGDDNTDGDLGGFLDIVTFFLEADSTDTPQTLTTSYGFDEADLSPNLATKLCNAYMALGTKGTSNLIASGDGGVSGGQSHSCSVFRPTFPSGCPYITSVGATYGIVPESAAFFSSGGFSNYFTAPRFQTSSIAAYLTALGSTYSGEFNKSGRGFPDVAAQGEGFEIVQDGENILVSGTSCSSPVFASVIGLINDRLIAAGKPALGFLNPWLYANAAALNDIVTGSNPGCLTDGFSAMTGWDPVTGLGTPNFAKLLAAAGL